MNQQLVVQNFNAVPSAAITAGATSIGITVTKGVLPPVINGDWLILNATQSGDYRDETSWEGLKVTGWTGTAPNLTLTVERAFYGTAASWGTSNSKIDCRLPEKSLNLIFKKIKDLTPTVLTGPYTIVNEDSGRMFTYSGSVDITVTTATGLDSDWSASFLQYGTGRIKIVGGSGTVMENLGLTNGAGTVTTVRASGTNQFVCMNPVVNGPVEQAHWTIPFIAYASGSWTMQANGAVTFTAGQLTIHPAAYVYFPANSITATNVAGWYYTEFSSLLVAKVYNNIYDPSTGLEPVIPATKTAFVAAAGTNTTQASGTLQGPTCIIPGGTMGEKGTLVLSITAQAINNTNTKYVYGLIGAAAQSVIQFNTVNSSMGETEAVLQNMSNSARQLYRTRTNTASSSSAFTFLTQDTTADFPVAIGLNPGTVANDWVAMFYTRVATISKG